MSLQHLMPRRYFTGMESTSAHSPRNVQFSGGWNAINLVSSSARSITPPPNPELPEIRSSESPFWNTPQPTTPISPSSDGIGCADTWLESMAKRREAARATVMASSRSAEPSSAEHIPSSRTLQPSPLESSHYQTQTPRTMRETRIVPPTNTPKRKLDFISRDVHTPRQMVQVLISVKSQGLLLSPSPTMMGPRATFDPFPTISPVSTVKSVPIPDKVEIEDSYASSEDGISPDEGEVYEVARILDERTRRGAQEFLVEWKNYEEMSWISEEDCFCEELIQSFRAVPRMRMLELSQADRQTAPESSQQRQLRAQRRAEKVPTVETREAFMRRVSNPPRDPKTGKFRRKTLADSTELKMSWQYDEGMPNRGEETIANKNVQCNTARFSIRPATPTRTPAPAVVYTRRDETTGKIIFQRTRAEDDAAAALPADDQDTSKTERHRSERDVLHTEGLCKTAESNWQKVKMWKRSKLRGREPSEILGCQSMEPPQSITIESSRTALYESPNQKRGPIHIRFDDDALHLKSPAVPEPSPPSHVTPPPQVNRASRSRMSMSCDDILRKARSAEKMAAAPSLLRHEFSGSMSHKHAQALINHTRGSPERAFGFSLPSNSVLLSIERDD